MKSRRQSDWINIHCTSPSLNGLIYLLLSALCAYLLISMHGVSRMHGLKDGELFFLVFLFCFVLFFSPHGAGQALKLDLNERLKNATCRIPQQRTDITTKEFLGGFPAPRFPALSSLPLVSLHHLSHCPFTFCTFQLGIKIGDVLCSIESIIKRNCIHVSNDCILEAKERLLKKTMQGVN